MKNSGLENERTQKELIKKIVIENSSCQNQTRIEKEILGYGPLEKILNLPDLQEIIIRDRSNLAYEQKGRMYILNDKFLSDLTFTNIVEKICAEAGLTLNLKKPFAEGRWQDFRIHIIRPPLIEKDFHLVLRKHPKNPWTFDKLKKENWAPNEAIQIIQDFILNKTNFLIVGPTSSGKTSVLNACLQELSPLERVVSIEDTNEIHMPNRISTKLLTQNSIEDNLSLIDQTQLLKQSLRLRPDRLVMGEVRGEEAKDLLLALSTGHRGSLGTLHSDSPRQALARLETLTQMGAPQWQGGTIRKLILSGLEGLLLVGRYKDHRFLKGIYKIEGLETTGFLIGSLYENN